MFLTLRPAERDDLGAIMAIERGAGYEAHVGRSSRAEHEAMFASDRHRYFVGAGEGGATVAFAILRDLDDPHGNVYLKRVAVTDPGRGLGTAFLGLLIDWTFADSPAHRIHLDCFCDNARAAAAYAKLGFSRDGVLREAYRAPDGRRRDLTLMALTRPEWGTQRNALVRGES